jgi:hypothetical protein
VNELDFDITGNDERNLWLGKAGSRSVQVPKYPDPLPPAMVMKVANSLIEAGARRNDLVTKLRRITGANES